MNVVSRGLGLVRTEPDFRRLIGAQAIAQMADGIAQAAITATLVFDPLAQDTPHDILQLFALTLLPYSAISPFLGVFVDRWSRRALLAATNALRGTLLVTLPLWGGWFPGDSSLYVATLLLLGFGRLFLTTKGASLPAILHERDLLKGNGISSGAGMISALTGGVIGLVAIRFAERNLVVVAAGVAYLIAVLIALRISAALAHPHQPERSVVDAARAVARELWDGVRAIVQNAAARLPLLAIFILRAIGIFIAIAAILLIRREFPGEAGSGGRLSTSGLALGAAGVGAFVGALVTPALGRLLDKPRLILVGFAISGAGIIALGGIQNVAAIMALMLIGGFGGFVSKVATDAQVQEVLPDEYRGRAFALYDILYNLASVVAGVVLVIFAESSLRLVLSITGGVTLLIAMMLAVLMARARVLEPAA